MSLTALVYALLRLPLPGQAIRPPQALGGYLPRYILQSSATVCAFSQDGRLGKVRGHRAPDNDTGRHARSNDHQAARPMLVLPAQCCWIGQRLSYRRQRPCPRAVFGSPVASVILPSGTNNPLPSCTAFAAPRSQPAGKEIETGSRRVGRDLISIRMTRFT